MTSPSSGARAPGLALFDLDHTLLLGDSDVLWCNFLVARGILDDSFVQRNRDIDARYRAATVGPAELSTFYISTLAGRSPSQWEATRQAFLASEILPRIPQASLTLVQQHQAAGDLVVLTTATNRFLVTLTARHLGIDHVIATEPELAEGVFTGRATGVLNMREGKPERLHAWLHARGERLAQFHSTGYSDSINDLPLLEAVDVPVVVHADARLAAIAVARGWKSLSLEP